MSRRRPSRTRRFGDVTVTAVRLGEGVGSRVHHGDKVFELPHWPARIEDIRVLPGGGLATSFKDGSSRLLTEHDAVQIESALVEVEGSSMGGHSPKAHGKMRFIVRSFGKWAKGKQHVCVRVIETKHPEILHGRDANGLCAWLKDQWAGTTKWRGSGAEAKARDAKIVKKAMKASEARIEAALGNLTEAQLDQLVADVREMTGIEPWDVLCSLTEAANVPEGLTFAGDPNPDSGEQQACATCQNFKPIGQDDDGDTVGDCTLFNWPVDNTLTCTRWEAQEVEGNVPVTDPERKRVKEAAAVVRTLPGGAKQYLVPVYNQRTALVAMDRLHEMGLTNYEKGKVREAAARELDDDMAGIGLNDDDVFEAIAARESLLNAEGIADTVAEIQEALAERAEHRYVPLMERWLALHGDSGAVRESAPSIEQALQRAAALASDPDPKPRVRSEVERRVLEASRAAYEPAALMLQPLQIAESKTRRQTTPDVFDDPKPAHDAPTEDDPLAHVATSISRTSIREAGAVTPGETFEDRILELARRPLPDLLDQAREAYEASGGATDEGRRRLRSSGALQLAQMIVEMGYDPDGDEDEDELDTAELPVSDDDDNASLDRLLAISGRSFQRALDSIARRVEISTPGNGIPWANAHQPLTGAPVREADILEAARAELRECKCSACGKAVASMNVKTCPHCGGKKIVASESSAEITESLLKKAAKIQTDPRRQFHVGQRVHVRVVGGDKHGIPVHHPGKVIGFAPAANNHEPIIKHDHGPVRKVSRTLIRKAPSAAAFHEKIVHDTFHHESLAEQAAALVESIRVKPHMRKGKGGRVIAVAGFERKGNARSLAKVGTGHVDDHAAAVPPELSIPTPATGAAGAKHPGRGPGGRVRNFSHMSDDKLLATGKAMRAHPVGKGDREALAAHAAEVKRRKTGGQRKGSGAVKHPTHMGLAKPAAPKPAKKPAAKKASRVPTAKHLDKLYDDDVPTGEKKSILGMFHSQSDEVLRLMDRDDMADLTDAAQALGHKGLVARGDRILAVMDGKKPATKKRLPAKPAAKKPAAKKPAAKKPAAKKPAAKAITPKPAAKPKPRGGAQGQRAATMKGYPKPTGKYRGGEPTKAPLPEGHLPIRHSGVTPPGEHSLSGGRLQRHNTVTVRGVKGEHKILKVDGPVAWVEPLDVDSESGGLLRSRRTYDDYQDHRRGTKIDVADILSARGRIRNRRPRPRW